MQNGRLILIWLCLTLPILLAATARGTMQAEAAIAPVPAVWVHICADGAPAMIALDTHGQPVPPSNTCSGDHCPICGSSALSGPDHGHVVRGADLARDIPAQRILTLPPARHHDGRAKPRGPPSTEPT